jgi:hypothetical protein
VRKAALEIGIDRQIDGRAQRRQMVADFIVTRLSAFAIVQANPALVEASALKPRCCSATALPTSKGLGNAKQPDSCIFRNVARFSAVDTGMLSPLD